MSEMVERVTRVIGSNCQHLDYCAYSPHHPVPCHTFGCPCDRIAKEVISAMREPTEAMVKAGVAQCPEDSFVVPDVSVAYIYTDMIDGALKDK